MLIRQGALVAGMVLIMAGCGSSTPSASALGTVAASAGLGTPSAAPSQSGSPTAAPNATTPAPSETPAPSPSQTPVTAQTVSPPMDAMAAVLKKIRQFAGARGSYDAQQAQCIPDNPSAPDSPGRLYLCQAGPSGQSDAARTSVVTAEVYADPASSRAAWDQTAAAVRKSGWSSLAAPRLGDKALLARHATAGGPFHCSEFAVILRVNAVLTVAFENMATWTGGKCVSWGSPGTGKAPNLHGYRRGLDQLTPGRSPNRHQPSPRAVKDPPARDLFAGANGASRADSAYVERVHFTTARNPGGTAPTA